MFNFDTKGPAAPFPRRPGETRVAFPFPSRPDPAAKPVYTWTARGDEKATDDHHDRIDFAFARAKGLTVVKAAIVGEKGPRSDLAVLPWPSDDRSTMAEVRF